MQPQHTEAGGPHEFGVSLCNIVSLTAWARLRTLNVFFLLVSHRMLSFPLGSRTDSCSLALLLSLFPVYLSNIENQSLDTEILRAPPLSLLPGSGNHNHFHKRAHFLPSPGHSLWCFSAAHRKGPLCHYPQAHLA